jgi:transcriptional/translational regulatory protein YebC/TACO1
MPSLAPGGSLASAGSVSWQFEQKGYISLPAEGTDFDTVFMIAADPARKTSRRKRIASRSTPPREEAARVAEALREAGFTLQEFELTWVAKNEMALPTDEAVKVMSLIEKLEELDDVQTVASNLEITDEVLASLSA